MCSDFPYRQYSTSIQASQLYYSVFSVCAGKMLPLSLVRVIVFKNSRFSLASPLNMSQKWTVIQIILQSFTIYRKRQTLKLSCCLFCSYRGLTKSTIPFSHLPSLPLRAESPDCLPCIRPLQTSVCQELVQYLCLCLIRKIHFQSTLL